ncbi:hypothetical protein [Haladaptatus pallidirubidus]|uniref:hypothetical protein n=1 Tax=Haladaptatus pallidirubidus TaxID=1008152 RepID=UPI001D109B22|nr:hypothetical protein [Haladaptatus pallidirubidus]
MIDILPALKREDSFVGRRTRTEFPEGNFPPWWEYRVRALHVGPQTRRSMLGYPLVALVTSGRTVRPFERGDSRPSFEGPDTGRAIDRTPPRRLWRSATANGAGFDSVITPSRTQALPP